jgi:hypothetical protein
MRTAKRKTLFTRLGMRELERALHQPSIGERAEIIAARAQRNDSTAGVFKTADVYDLSQPSIVPNPFKYRQRESREGNEIGNKPDRTVLRRRASAASKSAIEWTSRNHRISRTATARSLDADSRPAGRRAQSLGSESAAAGDGLEA